jgi:DNA-binding MarR family transcriptional regulator
MSSSERDTQLNALVEAFNEMGPSWVRWVQASVPGDTVSYARLRVLTALAGHPDGLTMSGLATVLGVTGRRVTVLVDALVEDGLAARYAHPTDRRSIVIEITEAGLARQHLVWQDHKDLVAVAFGDLSDKEQKALLTITRKLNQSFQQRLAERAAPSLEECDPETVLIRKNREVRAARPKSV